MCSRTQLLSRHVYGMVYNKSMELLTGNPDNDKIIQNETAMRIKERQTIELDFRTIVCKGLTSVDKVTAEGIAS